MMSPGNSAVTKVFVLRFLGLQAEIIPALFLAAADLAGLP